MIIGAVNVQMSSPLTTPRRESEAGPPDHRVSRKEDDPLDNIRGRRREENLHTVPSSVEDEATRAAPPHARTRRETPSSSSSGARGRRERPGSMEEIGANSEREPSARACDARRRTGPARKYMGRQRILRKPINTESYKKIRINTMKNTKLVRS